MTGVSRAPSTLLAISLAISSRSINIHFIPIDKLQAALPRDEVVQAALLGRDRQPIPRHTVDYSPFDGIQIIISMYKFDGAEPGIDEAFRAVVTHEMRPSGICEMKPHCDAADSRLS